MDDIPLQYQTAVKLLIPLWRGIDPDYKRRYARSNTPALVSTSLQVTPVQLDWLRRQAAAQGISIAEVLRRMIAREISNEA